MKKRKRKRYSSENLPPLKSKVTISPITYLTPTIYKPNTKNYFYNKNISATVISLPTLPHPPRPTRLELRHLVTVKTDTGEILKVSPDFLVERRNSNDLKLKIAARIKQLLSTRKSERKLL